MAVDDADRRLLAVDREGEAAGPEARGEPELGVVVAARRQLVRCDHDVLLGPVAPSLDEHDALAFEHESIVVRDAPVLEPHDTGVVAVGRRVGRQHLGVGVRGVAEVHRRLEPQAGAAQLGEGVLGRVLAGEAEHERPGDEPEHQTAVAHRAAGHRVLVPVALGRVHDLLGDEVVLDVADGGAASVAQAAPDREVLEEVVGTGESRDATIDHDRSRLATRFVRR